MSVGREEPGRAVGKRQVSPGRGPRSVVSCRQRVRDEILWMVCACAWVVAGRSEAGKLAERSLLWGVLFLSTLAHLGLGTYRAIADGTGAQFLGVWWQQTRRGLLAGEQKVPSMHCCISDARELWRRTGKQQAE